MVAGEFSPESFGGVLLTGNGFNFLGVPPVVGSRHRTDKPVAAAMKRFDVPRSVGRIAQRAAQPPHGGVDAVLEVDVCVGRPESRAKLFAS